MIWSLQMRKVMRLRRYWIILIVVFGIVMGAFGTQILGGIARTCPEPPVYADGVDEDVRAKLDMLYESNLLYCAQPSTDQANISEPIYWGSDGVASVLFFQPESTDDITIKSLAFGNFDPPEWGGARPSGFVPLQPDGPSLANQAPEGSGYFYHEFGAPGDDDFSVNLYVTGPAAVNVETTGRDFWKDLNQLLSAVRDETVASGAPSVTTRFPMPLLPERWRDAHTTWVNPNLADESGDPTFAILSTAELTEPTLFQVQTGPLASSVWVAGVVTGTDPILVLSPIEQDAAISLEPDAVGLWYSTQANVDMLLAHFAFPPQPAGAEFSAGYWHEAATRSEREPDHRWPVTVPTSQTNDE